jgi:asparagine synthetase B (glutamine-hydrolysing)
MDNKKLAKVIKIIVEREIEKRLPKLVKEEVKRQTRVLQESKKIQRTTKQVVEDEYDPFVAAEQVLQEERQETTKPKWLEGRQLSKNPELNEVLQQTQPFSSDQRNPQPQSVLDRIPQQQPLQEANGQEYEEWPTMNTNINPQQSTPAVQQMRQQMQQEFGGSGGQQNGLGVQTGLAGLDKILNRDNSELVKRFKR